MAFGVLLFVAGTAAAEPNIPGVSSRYDTEGMIEDILEAESEPIRRQERRIEDLEAERDAWNRLGRHLSNLEEAASGLFGFRNPFSDRRAASSDSDTITARANREAEQRRTAIEVEQIATADVFQSEPLPEDFDVPPGRYEFRVGEESAAFDFPGGALQEFTEAANQRVGDLVEVRSIRDTSQTRVLVFRSRLTGAENRLEFGEDALEFALQTGVLEEEIGVSFDVSPTAANTLVEDGDRGEAVVVEEELHVGPTASAIVQTEKIPLENHYLLEIELSLINLGKPEFEEPEPPEGPVLPDLGAVELDDVRVPFIDSLVEIPEWIPPEPPEEIEDLEILYVLTDGREIALPRLEDTDDYVRIELPVGEFAEQFEGMAVRNRNTFREVRVREARVIDPERPGEHFPRAALEEADDAVFTVDGVRVTRDTNEIDDVIDDVTLELHRAGTVTLDIEPDFERIEERVIEFLVNYNEVMTEINILTRTEREVIDQIGWFEPDEVEAAEERLGLLQGNTTLNQLRSRLQTIMMNPYETSAGSRIRLLSQVGVSTDSRQPGSGIDFSRLRGYLELDEQLFEEAIRNEHRALRDLFGRDSSGDGTIDTGAAYEVERYVRGFTRTGGLLATRRQTISSSIDRAETEINRQSERLSRREDQLRREFGEMESAVNSMENMRRRLEGLQQNR